jgi:hypothetical protein
VVGAAVKRAFWVVWCPQSGPPTYRHETEEGAMAEARRLAGQCPGREFIVLRALASVQTQTVVVDRLWADGEIPF